LARLQPQPADEAALDELFSRYTMEREREVHREFLGRLGLTSTVTMRSAETPDTADDGIELF
jgi:hypothetical protein